MRHVASVFMAGALLKACTGRRKGIPWVKPDFRPTNPSGISRAREWKALTFILEELMLKIRLIEFTVACIIIALLAGMAFFPEWMIKYVIIMDI